jgi:hypothetical protein
MASPHVEFYMTNVPSSGTAVQIANTSRKVLKVWVKPHDGNPAGKIYFGDSSVSATASGWSMENGTDARPHVIGQLFDFTEAPPLQSTFWVDASTNGDDIDTVFLLE